MNTSAPVPSRYALKKLACALAALSIMPPLWATPENGQVITGQGSIEQQGKNTLIQQASERLSINWQSFDVNGDERVQFIQPTDSSIAFNRILSNKGSLIQGRIDANGQVVLLNPNGIIFTETASVNVGALVASGLEINNQDFLNSQFTLNALEGTQGRVINAGLLNAATGGNISLLGQQVENKGLISANLGSVTLAAGKEAVLTFERDGLIGIRISEAALQQDVGLDAAVINSGEINAQGGKVLLTASTSKNIFSQAVNVGELNEAKSAVVHNDGSFTLGAGADVTNKGAINVGAGEAVMLGETVINEGSVRADNDYGDAGSIELSASKASITQGNSLISASANTTGKGGDIKLLGTQAGVLHEAKVVASGVQGGGQILIGGDKTGANPLIANAQFTHISEAAEVAADALQTGKGGKLIVFADDTARIHGKLSVQGGVKGEGGFVETSGLKGLEVWNSPELGAPSGKAGHWLIDPYNIQINASSSVRPDRISTVNSYTNAILTKSIFTSKNDAAQIGWSIIRNVLDNGSGGTVEIKTSGGPDNAGGTITVAANFDFSSFRTAAPSTGYNSTLILNAGKNIEFTDTVSYVRASNNNRLNMDFNALGSINFNKATIASNGGDLAARTQNGSILSKSTLSTARMGEISNNSGKIQLAAATGSLLLNNITGAGTNVFYPTARSGNAGAIDLQANNGAINITGTLLNQAGLNRFNSANNGTGAALTLSAARITSNAITTSANTATFTATESIALGAFNSATNCRGSCTGDINISAAPNASGINLTQSAAWQIKGSAELTLGDTGTALLTQSVNKFGAAGAKNSLRISTDSATINSGSDIILAGAVANNLAITTANTLKQTEGSIIRVNDTATFNATSINLTQKNNDFGTLLNLSATTDAAIADANGLLFNNLYTAKLAIDSTGDAQFNGTLEAKSPISITQNGAGGITLLDNLTIASASTVSLTTASNQGALNYLGTEKSIWTVDEQGLGTVVTKNGSLFNFSGFNSLSSVDGGQLIGPNTSNNWLVNGLNTGSLNTMQFAGMSELIGGTESDHFALVGSGYITGRISGGAGADTIESGFNVGGDWYLDATDNNWLRLFSGSNQYFSSMENLINFTDGALHGPTGTNTWRMTGIDRGTLNDTTNFKGMTFLFGNSGDDRYVMGPDRFAHDGIVDVGGIDELIIENLTDTTSIWTITAPGRGSVAVNFQNSQSLYPIRFNGIEVFTGSNNDTLSGPQSNNNWLINGINTGTLNSTMTFNGMNKLIGGTESDHFALVGSGYITDHISGGEGADTIESGFNVGGDWYLDASDNNWLRLFSGSNQYFSSMENLINFTDGALHGPTGNNTWRMTGIDRGTLNDTTNFKGMTFLFGNSGEDRYVMGPDRFAHDGIVDVGGIDELIIENPTDTTSIWTITAPGRGSVAVNFQNSQSLYPIRFNGIDIFTGSNNDILNGPQSNNSWLVNGINTGSLNNTMTFAGISELRGNSLDDRFNVGAGGLIQNGVFGDAGTDYMSAGTFTGNSWEISAEREGTLTTGFGAINQNFSDIEVLVGDSNSMLKGPQTNNNWRITGNNAGTLNGTLAFTGMNLLMGNSGDDHFEVSGFVFADGLIGGNGSGFDAITALGGPAQWTLSGTGSGSLHYPEIQSLTLYFSGIEAINSN